MTKRDTWDDLGFWDIDGDGDVDIIDVAIVDDILSDDEDDL